MGVAWEGKDSRWLDVGVRRSADSTEDAAGVPAMQPPRLTPYLTKPSEHP